MPYKTAIHELIQANPSLHERLRTERRLLATIERLAAEMRETHRRLTSEMETHGLDSCSASSRAWELATAEMQATLDGSDDPAAKPNA